MKSDVSVVVICFNQESFIGEALASVMAQSAFDTIREVIVVDDGSTDASISAISAHIDQYPLVRLVQKSNGGPASARNAGIVEASGTHLAFLDGDDAWLPRKLEIQLDALRLAPRSGLVYSDFFQREADDSTKPIRVCSLNPASSSVLEMLFVQGATILPSTSVISRRIFDDCGLFDETLPANEDPDMWLRAAAGGYTFLHVPQPLVVKRVVRGSVGSDAGINFGAHRAITRKLIALCPDLKALEGPRTSRILMREALATEPELPRTTFVRAMLLALRGDPRNRVAWIYLLVAVCVPGKPAGTIRRLKALVGARLKAR